jgi:tRNA pseudouridine65 synthase
VAKPSGLLVHRTALDSRATSFAVQRLRDQLGRPVYPAHRLDRATSGVLLFALEPAVHARLAAAFEAGEVAKRYLAIVRGWPAEALTIDHALSRLEEDAPGAARPARTHLTRLATAELPLRVDRYPTSRYALVELEPLSGRRHQLRRHLRHADHPIIGDTTYGQGRHNRLFRERFGSTRLLLHALSLRLRHPLTGEWLSIVAPPPADFAAVATALGWPTIDSGGRR